MHLRMTGNLLLVGRSDRRRMPRVSAGAAASSTTGGALLFTDPRRFGQAVVLDGGELDEYFAARLGSSRFGRAHGGGALPAGRRAAGRR